MTIALRVFRESAAFDPMESSKVRVAVSDLRRRLAEYYDLVKQVDPIEISIPVGSYVPNIWDQRTSIRVRRFENWHPENYRSLCGALTEELITRLNETGWFRAEHAHRSAYVSRYALRGSIEQRGNILRLNISLADLGTRKIAYSRSYERRREQALTLM